ncbi:hypothetical protein EVAR_78470_1 [Eumeta japonica]|uniref:Uncharacterized protein n=1 Tax=Eumeta variegata TaxID=151549 RepID=A0A4C1TY66_EUMVA|nr:hypothetical protein EVAR_78470_1 [Eumeta japonica]
MPASVASVLVAKQPLRVKVTSPVEYCVKEHRVRRPREPVKYCDLMILLLKTRCNDCFLESDQCDSDGDVDDCLFYGADIENNHSSEQEITEESVSTTKADGSDSESSDDDNIPIAQLRPSKYYYGKNRYNGPQNHLPEESALHSII